MTLTRYRSITWVLVVCFSFTMLTGCQTLELEIVDPTEPVKLAAPLIDSMTINVATERGEGGPTFFASTLYERIEPQFTPDLLNTMKQHLLDSRVAVAVGRSKTCMPGMNERTLCIKGTILNSTGSFLGMLKAWGKVLVATVGFAIPLFFMTRDITDVVIAEVKLLDKVGKEVARFQVQSEFHVIAGMMREDAIDKPYFKNNEELANRIVRELAKHPHWFQPLPNQAP